MLVRLTYRPKYFSNSAVRRKQQNGIYKAISENIMYDQNNHTWIHLSTRLEKHLSKIN